MEEKQNIQKKICQFFFGFLLKKEKKTLQINFEKSNETHKLTDYVSKPDDKY